MSLVLIKVMVLAHNAKLAFSVTEAINVSVLLRTKRHYSDENKCYNCPKNISALMPIKFFE
jgi:hypothetical protein